MTNQNEMTKKVTKITLSKNELPKEEYISLLKESIKELPFKGTDTFLSNPVLIDENYLENSKKLCSILNSVLVLIAYNYFRDTLIQEVYQLDRESQEILLMAEGVPFEIGMYRPDFIFDINGNPGICKISCQYPVNGWMYSSYINQVADKLTKKVDKNSSVIPNQHEFIDEFSSRFDTDDTLFFIHTEEKSTEVNLLKNELAKKGIDMVSIQPKDLQIIDGQLKVGDKIARQFYLEMDKEELKTFDKDILKIIIRSGRCINDVRAIILINDKRILALLNNKQAIGSYINQEDYQFLKTYLIPSFTIYNPQDRDFLLNSLTNWIMKPNNGGLGIDTYIRNECSTEVWEDLVKNKWKNYMVQPYLEQKKFELTHNDSQQSVNLIATDLCFNGKYFGPGFFRASSEKIITIQESNTSILPCVSSKTKSS